MSKSFVTIEAIVALFPVINVSTPLRLCEESHSAEHLATIIDRVHVGEK